MTAAEADAGYLASFLGLDRPLLVNVIASPNAALVSILLQAVTGKAHEFDALSAEKLQVDIELETVGRRSEARALQLKAFADQATGKFEEVQQNLKQTEVERDELKTFRTKSINQEGTIKALKRKIASLESSSRATLRIIESNNKRDQDVTIELTKQREHSVQLSREITSLQQSEQKTTGQLHSAKYREEALKQQLELTQQNGEWLERELKSKNDDALKDRRDKGARIAALQREKDDANEQIELLQRNELQLRERLSAMQFRVDEGTVKLKKQEESFAATVESYKLELEHQRRLVDMSDKLGKKHKERIHELEFERERLKDGYESEIRRLRVEAEQEKQSVSRMNDQIHRMDSMADELRSYLCGKEPGSTSQTPQANNSAQSLRCAPFAMPGSHRTKTAIAATYAIEQLYQVKGQLATERRRNQQLSENLDNMLSALEAKAPEIQEAQAENEVLRNEIAHMSEMCQQSFEERDVAKKSARRAEDALAGKKLEVQIQKTQLYDLSMQIQMLLFSVYAFEKGTEQLTDDDKNRLHQLERGEISEQALRDFSDTHEFISQKLVVFKDIQSLQAKNQSLLRITRELANQIESEEALAAKHRARLDSEKAEKLQNELDRMAEETKFLKKSIGRYKAERDIFRRIFQQRGTANIETQPPLTLLPEKQQPLVSLECEQSEAQIQALNQALQKHKSEYVSFRNAQEEVRKDLQSQVDSLVTDKSSLQNERLNLLSKLGLETERHEIMRNNFIALRSEWEEIQKKNRALSENAVKQDQRTQQVAEELIETKGLLDSITNENANLKAEKRLWKGVQDRMIRDNEHLIEEKHQLNHLLASQQSIDNERSAAESESRRNAQAKIENLDRKLTECQRRLHHEMENSQNLQLRKEFEAEERQGRIDELLKSHSQLREEHASVKASKDHLQLRVEDMKLKLQDAEAQSYRLPSRPLRCTNGSTDSPQQSTEVIVTKDLEMEIDDLRRDLSHSNTQLEYAKAQVEQFRQLSQGSEDALDELRSSQDLYYQKFENLLTEKDDEIAKVRQQFESVSAKLSQSNASIQNLQDSHDNASLEFHKEKGILEEDLSRLKKETARCQEASRFHRQDLRAQTEIASKAQSDYEQELVKHAAAAKSLQDLRADYHELKSLTVSLRAAAETAKVNLKQSETSWERQKLDLEQELRDLASSREDVNAQNKLLHTQLEALSRQLTSKQRCQDSEDFRYDNSSHLHVDNTLEGLRELNSYLRREKEILEVQFELKTQETKRLQYQATFTQSQLDETRLKLDEERGRHAQEDRAQLTHEDILEKLNELNLYRESNAALRTENSALRNQLVDRCKKVEELEGVVRPIEAKLDALRLHNSHLEAEIEQTQEDRDRWQRRTENILLKYDRVDPEEIDSLKSDAEGFQKERDRFIASTQSFQAKISDLESLLESERENWQSTRGKLTEQFKERSKRLTGEKNELTLRSSQLQTQLNTASNELEEARKLIHTERQTKEDLERQLFNFRKQLEDYREQMQQEDPLQQTPDVSAETTSALEQQLRDIRSILEDTEAKNQGLEQRLEKMKAEAEATILGDKADRKVPQTSSTSTQTVGNGEYNYKQDHLKRSQTEIAISSDVVQCDSDSQPAETRADTAQHAPKADENEQRIQQIVKERCDKMRDALNQKLKDSRTKLEEEFRQKDKDLRLKFEQEKRVQFAENSTGVLSNEGMSTEMSQPERELGDTRHAEIDGSCNDELSVLSRLDDTNIRKFLASNATVKSIIAANIRKKLEAESVRIKTEMEAKIQSTRDQAQLMESKKSVLRINMAENKLKTANIKLDLLSKAATETPLKSVAEVWATLQVKSIGPGSDICAKARDAQNLSTPAPTYTNPSNKSMSSPSTLKNFKDEIPVALSQQLDPAATVTEDIRPDKTLPAAEMSIPMGQPPTTSDAATAALEQLRSQEISPTGQALAIVTQNLQTQSSPSRPATVLESGLHTRGGGGCGRSGHMMPCARNGSSSHESGPDTMLQAVCGRGRASVSGGSVDGHPGEKRMRGDPEIERGAKRARGGH